MTVDEIVAELPKFTEPERREILRRILELDGAREEIKFADDLLLAACRYIDEREREDAALFSQEAAIQTFQAMDSAEAKNANQSGT